MTAPRLLTPAFGALFAAALVFFTAGSTVLPVASRFAAGPLGADATGVGIAIGAFAIAALVLRPVVGWASDRFGRRPLLVGGGLMTVAALGLHLFVTTLPLFIVARSLLGIAEAFFFVAAVAAVSDLAPPERRGVARPSTSVRWRSTWASRSARRSVRRPSRGAGTTRCGLPPWRWRARRPS